MDFEFDPLPEGFAPHRGTGQRGARCRSSDRGVVPTRDTAVQDEDLIRTKVSSIPTSVSGDTVDIVGLDKQATVAPMCAVPPRWAVWRVTKLENKGKGNKRVRVEIIDA